MNGSWLHYIFSRATLENGFNEESNVSVMMGYCNLKHLLQLYAIIPTAFKFLSFERTEPVHKDQLLV